MAVLQEEKKAEEKLAKDAGKQQQQREASTGGEEKDGEPMEVEKTEIAGSKVMTLGAERPPESTIHTQLEHLHLGASVSVGPRVQGHQIRSQLARACLIQQATLTAVSFPVCLSLSVAPQQVFPQGPDSPVIISSTVDLLCHSQSEDTCRNTSENNYIKVIYYYYYY